MASRRQTLDVLRPYLEGEGPNSEGEWGMHCPLHDDAKRSASINLEKGKWYCNACQIGGDAEDLLDLIKGRDTMVASFVDAESVAAASRGRGGVRELPSDGKLAGWHSALMSSPEVLEEFQAKRGLSDEIIIKYQIGYSVDDTAFTLPIRDAEGELVNVRFYDLHPADIRRKIWGVTGHNTPVLYPIDQLDNEVVGVVEGEWDALLSIQNGEPALTRTGAAKVWNNSWSGLFKDKKVWICHDMDQAGQVGNRKVARALERHAAEVRIVELPYPVDPKHGKDLTDYYHEDGHTRDDFRRLLKGAKPSKGPDASTEDHTDINVLDSFSSDSYGKVLRMRVTITGKRTPTYLLPEEVDYSCGMDAGIKCETCPMKALQGQDTRSIDPGDPVLLEMMGSNHKAVRDILRDMVGIPKCNRVAIEATKLRSVEELTARPSVEIARVQMGKQGDYINRRIVSVGRHDTVANSTVEIVGTVYPNPKTQHNEFQAWEVTKTETNVDKFRMTDAIRRQLMVFQPSGQRRSPLRKLGEIAEDLAQHVTHIYGRKEMHAAMDLVFHSALSFNFDGYLVSRGWLELLVVGDTRTGKSEVAQSLIRHYGAGEMLSCESATFAGVVGGLQQLSSGKEWEITWGAIPLNDRRLVALDEVSGLSTEQIAQMSSIRSSGEAQLTKIRSERTWARTRLIWLGNPRNGRMSDYTYGVQALRPLVGNSEDIARYDLAMSVGADEVDPGDINRRRPTDSPPVYSNEACSQLVQWAWSRSADDIVWGEGATDAVYAAALDLGGRYTEDPPLIQAANVRIKVARVAVALAIRTFSTDTSGQQVIVEVQHVTDAVKFIDMLYGLKGFGYKEHSEELIREITEAGQFYDEAKQYLYNRRGLPKFLRMTMGRFRSQDMQDMLGIDKEEAGAVINKLWEFRMITRRGPEIRLQPMLHELLREIKE